LRLERKLQISNISESNLEKIFAFLRRAEIEGIGVVQRTKYVFSLKSLFKVVEKDFEEYSSKDLEEFLLYLKRFSPKTAQTRWYAIVKFFKFLGKEELFKDIKPSFHHKGMKLPEDILTLDEVQRMVREAYSIRDKALISVLYESGVRIGELLSMRIRNAEFDEFGGVLLVDGKTGMRRVRIVQSVKELKDWLYYHPFANNPESFLWLNAQHAPLHVGYNAVMKMLKEVALRCGVTKRVHPHLFRHSRATHLANKLTESQMRVYFGWTGGSKMSAIYVHLSGRDVDEAILELNGVEKPRNDPEFNEFLKEMYKKWQFERGNLGVGPIAKAGG
jgi:integrase/recombinase XerD